MHYNDAVLMSIRSLAVKVKFSVSGFMGEQYTEKDRLLEIYKLHVNVANDISNRRVSVNRHFTFVISGLVVAFVALLNIEEGSAGKQLMENLQYFVEGCIIAVGGVGMVISVIWWLSVNTYLNANSVRYTAMKELEARLEFQFMGRAWELMGPSYKTKSYKDVAIVELILPIAFLSGFVLLYSFGVYLLLEKLSFYRALGVLIGMFISVLVSFVFSFGYFWIVGRRRKTHD